MRNETIEKLKPLLETPKEVVIIPHKNPDGDALGSALGLYHYLTQKGHSCTVIAPNNYPDFLKWLPGNGVVKQFESDPATGREILKKAQLIFTLDFNALNRTATMSPLLKEIRTEGKAIFVMIDHHEQPDNYAEYRYSIPGSSSTCELIYNVIDKFGDADQIDVTTATCLYTGIMTDTGSFKFSSVSGNTHRIVANLIDKGANHTLIHQNIYDTKTYNQLQLLGVALHNLHVLPQKKTAYITLSQKELDDHHFRKGDTEGVVNYGLSLKGIVLAAIFIENTTDRIIKISLRSKGKFDVNQIARKHFDGGGHINAAGGRSLKSLHETTQYFEELLEEYPILASHAD